METKELRRWSDLPQSTPDDFEITPSAAKLDGIQVGGLRGRLIRETEHLLDASRHMGNCLDTYVDRARTGDTAVVLVEDAGQNETYAAAFSVDGTSIRLIEVNSKNNKHNVPEDFSKSLDQAVQLINREARRSPSVADDSGGLSLA